ncbi:PREDICTED: protein YIPF1 [Dinoponera quadriceps]|uniref:Protein YIPF n=1 Tax=Dinoponera quadriceps TaxID=609295 RepID=A0A6P3XZD3_DINQU|nr:PREDICTED: protein YIPF1 [Dinoponera quadriceps]
MDGGQPKNTDSQFISFNDFTPISQAGNTEGQLGTGPSTHQPFNNLPNDSTGVGIIEDLQGLPNKNESNSQHSFWAIEYYQKFFNVNTNDVLGRLKRSMIPYGRDNYFITHIRPNPDLYGPFWICLTLVFSIAISGNMANYLQTAGSTKFHWRYDFHVVSYAATCIFLYAWLVPLALWGALKWTNSSRNTEEELIESYAAPRIIELLCLYGYSLTIYIPVTFLWTIQIGWLQWCLAIVATLLSVGVLLRSLLPVIAGKHRIIYVAVILGMHLLLVAGFMLYFFHPSKSAILPTNELLPSPTQAKVLHNVENMLQNNSQIAATSSTS